MLEFLIFADSPSLILAIKLDAVEGFS